MNGNGKNDSERNYHVPNLERALHIFELLNQHPLGLTITDVSEKLGFPRNSAHRIMMTLAERGYLYRDNSTKKFRLTEKLLMVGYGAFKEKNLIEYALEPMRELRDKTKETVPIGVISNNRGIVIEQMPGLHMFRYYLEPGRQFYLHTAAPGKAIIAFLPEKEKRDLIQQLEFKRFNKNTITSTEEYLVVMQETKKRGYSIDTGEEYEGLHCVGAPVFNHQGYPVAAIWITGPSGRLPQKDFPAYGTMVKETAMSISEKLGYGILQEIHSNKK